MKHEITVEGLREWQAKEVVTYASCTTPNKQLYATLRGCYEVWHNKELILVTQLPTLAVETYNSIN